MPEIEKKNSVPKIALPEARKKIIGENVAQDIVVYLKSPRRRRKHILIAKCFRNVPRQCRQESGPFNLGQGEFL